MASLVLSPFLPLVPLMSSVIKFSLPLPVAHALDFAGRPYPRRHKRCMSWFKGRGPRSSATLKWLGVN